MSAPLSLALLAACEDDDVSSILQGGQLLQQAVMEMASTAAHDAGSASGRSLACVSRSSRICVSSRDRHTVPPKDGHFTFIGRDRTEPWMVDHGD